MFVLSFKKYKPGTKTKILYVANGVNHYYFYQEEHISTTYDRVEHMLLKYWEEIWGSMKLFR